MNELEKLKDKAIKLVNKLQENITTGKKQITENYGQKEIMKFEDKHISDNNKLSYVEKCDIRDILFKVSSIS